ncbi:NEDD8-activating enzyme E1 catalytic subunit [Venturia inaequalis]|nr:NEDD8-activating enzyme E1 catalytic subunit [Venturia inaequalis]
MEARARPRPMHAQGMWVRTLAEDRQPNGGRLWSPG